jgi:hypothetical protein
MLGDIIPDSRATSPGIRIAERRHIAPKAQISQPRRHIHAVILGSEKRQTLVDDDIPLPAGLPAAAQGRVSRLWPINDRVQSTPTANHYPLSAANDAIPVWS